ncbi:cupin domain-containing protein [Polaribacter aquimarinus]|uniref:Cupin domain-containing protein n=1 Tax=Polaribacter aquimarinus TaxID=2100726 RepID=A0A2U2J8D6_9FLAO|nr:cupin domain-containing protein [Polaribacter aquimarinus]PWG04584.1 cupin domain-containing protein [Polaribacter aquimarinus]
MSAVNIQEKFDLFQDHWSPKKIGELNGQQILLAKIKGEFVFHKHDNEDELFLVKKGVLEMHLRDEIITINEGEFYIVPKGVEHKPVAKEEVHILLFEPLSTKHTGDVVADITVETYESI